MVSDWKQTAAAQKFNQARSEGEQGYFLFQNSIFYSFVHFASQEKSLTVCKANGTN